MVLWVEMVDAKASGGRSMNVKYGISSLAGVSRISGRASIMILHSQVHDLDRMLRPQPQHDSHNDFSMAQFLPILRLVSLKGIPLAPDVSHGFPALPLMIDMVETEEDRVAYER